LAAMLSGIPTKRSASGSKTKNAEAKKLPERLPISEIGSFLISDYIFIERGEILDDYLVPERKLLFFENLTTPRWNNNGLY